MGDEDLAPAAPEKHAVMLIAENLPCGGRTLKALLPAGKHCAARTLLGLFAKRFKLDAATLALRTPSGGHLAGAAKVTFDDALSVFTVVRAPLATPLSAHATLATFAGVEGGRATFAVARYLRYAPLAGAHAEGPRDAFAFDVSEADAQTAELADETTSALSAVVASLRVGDDVELEWLQILMPGHPRRVVRQCQKLVAVDAKAKAALVAAFPEPKLLTPRVTDANGDPLPGCRCAICGPQLAQTIPPDAPAEAPAPAGAAPAA